MSRSTALPHHAPGAPDASEVHAAAPRPADVPRGLRRCGLLALVAAALLGVGCGPKTDDRMIKWVTPEEAQKAMNDKTGPLGLGGRPDGVYLDPRNEGQYLLGHIPGAINIPFPKLETMYPVVRDRTVIVVYSTDYADDDFAKGASKRLMELGSRNVLTLRGGMKAWEQSGGEIEK